MLGNEIDDNGLYLGWSSLFDQNNLEESKKLPFPNFINIITSEIEGDGISIEEYVNEYSEAKTNKEKLEIINRLIRYVDSETKNKELKIAWFKDDKAGTRTHLIYLLKKHNTLNFTINKTQAALKNFISNKLQVIILGTKNYIGSHAPISMDALHEAADSSENKVTQWTTMNPGYIPIMLTQNMVGKKGVGIAANGQKASFIWKYYMTEEINNPSENRKYMEFPEDFSISRIEGRAGGNSREIKIKVLPNINTLKASDKDKIFFESNLNHYIPSDLMSSQMISAATDNAKELILDRINANTDLSKVYMYLITLGFDVKDIVKFMTSNAINIIAKNSTNNIFNNTQQNPIHVAYYILNKINSKLGSDEKPYNTPSIKKYKFVLDSKIDKLINSVEESELLNIKLDILEFIKIYKLSLEFSNLGRLLGINLGVATTKEALMKFKKFIKDIVSAREVEMGIKSQEKGKFELDLEKIDSLIPEHLQHLINNIDSNKFLNDKNYRNQVIEYYDLIKGSVNVFAVVENTPLFQTILEILNIVNVVDKYSSVKGNIANIIFDKILSHFPYVDIDYSMQLLPIINLILIGDYIQGQQIYIPIKKGWKYLNSKWQEQEFAEDSNFTIGSEKDFGLTPNSSISSFHYIMDNYVIPLLKNGELFPQLKNNSFIKNLIPTTDKNKTKYKMNLDLRAILNNPESKVTLKNIINGLLELQNIKFGNKSLLDIFMLYSLIVDLNQQGSDRFTDLFGVFVNESSNQNNLMLDYFKYVGENDFKQKDLLEKVDDLSINDFLIALSLLVTREEGHNEPTIKVINDDGTISYKVSVGYNKYKEMGDFMPLVMSESPNDKLIRINNREQYGFGLIYHDYMLDVIENLKTENILKLIESIRNLLSNGYIKLNLECK